MTRKTVLTEENIHAAIVNLFHMFKAIKENISLTWRETGYKNDCSTDENST